MFWSWHSALVYISWPWLSPFRGWVVWLWRLLVNLYIWLTISSCYGSVSLAIVLIWRDGGLSTLCHSCRSAWLQRVLKAFAGLAYLCSQEGLVWLWHLLINLYIWLTISCCYGSIPLAIGMIGRDGGLSNLCHSCGFACQERVLETFPGPDDIHSEDWVSLTMTFTGKFVHMAHDFILLCLSAFGLRFDREGWWFEHSVS